jgi:hypothetical protein
MKRTKETIRRKFFLILVVLSVLGIPCTLRSGPIPEAVLQCVAYLVKPGSAASGDEANRPIGTGFFIGHQYAQRLNRRYVFLVTSKHVLFDENGILHTKLLLRMNRKDTNRANDFDIIKQDAWFVHPDEEAVDLAVQPVVPREAKFLYVRSSDFVTKDLFKERNIGIGDDVFYAGLLSYHSGHETIVPIVRFGRLALITNEKTVDGKYYHFIDAGSIPGHSGSPVFLWATPSRVSTALVAGPRIFGLYGVVSGVLEYQQSLKVTVPKETGRRVVPLDSRSGGVTAVVPVRYLIEILESPRLREAIGLAKPR